MRVVWTCSMIFVISACAAAGGAQAAGDEAAVVLTPKPSPQPRINGAKIFGVRPGHPLLFTIAATGRRPMQFAAEGLPEGLTLDGQTGRISGRTAVRGEHVVVLRAANELGAAERRFAHRRRRPLGADAAHGLEQLVHLDEQRQRQDHARRGRRHGRQRHDQSRLHVREHRRLLDGQPQREGAPSRATPKAGSTRTALSRHEGAGRLHPSPRPEGRALHLARPDHLRRLRRQLSARGPGRPALRRVGFRFPQVRLVLLWKRRRRGRPGPLEETL